MNNIRTSLKNNRFFRTFVYRFRSLRECRSYCVGRNNKVSIQGIRVGSKIQVKGNSNQVLVNDGAVLKKAKLFIQGNNNRIVINSNAYLEGTVVHIEDNNCLIEIGERTFIGPSHLACTEDGRSIVIGNNCMLSSNINVRTGDSHSIVDMDGKRVNPAQSVSIGDHCWIGEGAKIMKGVTLQKDTIVASGAIVTKSFASNCILAGNPAKVIKENVNWDENRI